MKMLLFFLLWPIVLLANWQVGGGTGAYLGQIQLQSQWSWDEHHHVFGSLGYTRDPILKDLRQISVAYLWKPFEKKYINHTWSPLFLGPFLTYSDHPYYYFESHDRYNNDHYYDVTNTRWGARLATQLASSSLDHGQWVYSLEASLLERAFINFANNPDQLDIFKYYWSLGFSIRWEWN